MHPGILTQVWLEVTHLYVTPVQNEDTDGQSIFFFLNDSTRHQADHLLVSLAVANITPGCSRLFWLLNSIGKKSNTESASRVVRISGLTDRPIFSCACVNDQHSARLTHINHAKRGSTPSREYPTRLSQLCGWLEGMTDDVRSRRSTRRARECC